jgi:hypothetical protein
MGRTPNDDRSDSMNPNNDNYWDSVDNHSDQLNPNNERFQGGNSGSQEEDDED